MCHVIQLIQSIIQYIGCWHNDGWMWRKVYCWKKIQIKFQKNIQTNNTLYSHNLGYLENAQETKDDDPANCKYTLIWSDHSNNKKTQVFEYLKQGSRIQVWLYENTDLRIEGNILGFDEYMNIVLDETEEIYTKKSQRKKIGRILLKGDNISLIRDVTNVKQ